MTPIWHNIIFSNVTASGLTGSRIAGIIWGLPEAVVSNVTLYNVNIDAPSKTFEIYHARGVRIVNSNLTSPSTTNTLILYDAEVTLTNTAANTNLMTIGGLAKPPTNNTLAFFNATAAITETRVLGTSPITLGGSTLSFTQDSVSFSNDLNVVTASTLGVTSGSNTYYGMLGGSGVLTLNLAGSSRLALQADSSGFGGGLIVSNTGTLLVNNTAGSGTGTGTVSVVGGATLGGGGIIGGPVVVNGTLAPGNSPGTLTISNDLVVSGGAAWQYDLGTSSDLTAVSGNSTLGGILNITDSGGFTNGTYALLTYGGALSYNGISLGAVPSGFSYAIDTGTVGQVNLVVSSLAPPVDPFVTWQLQYFNCTNCSQAVGNADPDGDGMSNTNEFLAGTNPTNGVSALRIISVVRQTTDVAIVWTTAGGRTNAVQATTGSYTTNFVDLSGPIVVPGTGDVTNNYVDGGGATNNPSRFYRIRFVP